MVRSKSWAFNNPTPQTADLYIKSINATVDQYRAFLEAVRTDTLVLPNYDFDTGNPTRASEYSLTDDSYAKLLAQLSNRKFDLASPELRANILQFYSDLSLPIETKKDAAHWQGVLTALDQLKTALRFRLSQAARRRRSNEMLRRQLNPDQTLIAYDRTQLIWPLGRSIWISLIEAAVVLRLS